MCDGSSKVVREVAARRFISGAFGRGCEIDITARISYSSECPFSVRAASGFEHNAHAVLASLGGVAASIECPEEGCVDSQFLGRGNGPHADCRIGGSNVGHGVDVGAHEVVSALDEGQFTSGGGIGGDRIGINDVEKNRSDLLVDASVGVDHGDRCNQPGVSVRGPNFERNQRKKKNRREAKAAAKIVKDHKEKPLGFFSDCDANVRKELRDSRAAALIAKNRLEARRDTHKLECQNDDIAKITAKARALSALAAATKDTEVGGWARTVLSSTLTSVVNSACSASDSLPSLSSIEPDDSASNSSKNVKNDNVVELSDEEMAYRRDFYALKEYFEGLGSYTEVDEFRSFAQLSDSYPTVDIKYVPDSKFL